MHVLYIITGLRIGGAERLLYLTCRELMRRYRVEIDLVYFDPVAPLAPKFREIGVRLDRMRPDAAAPARLCGTMLKRKIDLVHTHLIHADLLGRSAGLLLRAIRPVALVSTAHGTEWFRRQGGPLAAAVRLLDRVMARPGGSRVIAVSRSVRRILVQRERLRAGDMDLLYNGVEIPSAPAGRQKKGANGLRCLYLGRLSPEKNVHCLIRAVALLRESGITCSIVGEGECRDELQRLSFKLGIGDRVVFSPACLEPEPLLHEHDVLVLPSRHEGLGLVVLEAFAAGLPVIGSRIEGIVELLGKDRGLLFRDDDDNDLAEKLRLVGADSEANAERVRCAHAYVRDHHSISAYTEALYNLYREALTGSRPE